MPSQKEASVFLKYINVYVYAINYPSISRLTAYRPHRGARGIYTCEM
jgi:hypothetical protein